MKEVKNLKQFYDVIESNEKVIVYWFTEWCPDCFVIRPHLGRLENDFKEYLFVSLDRDHFIELAKHLEIYGIPSFLVFEYGEEAGRLVNKLRKTYVEVKTFIEETIRR